MSDTVKEELFKARFINITDWDIQVQFNTTGTRAKIVVVDPKADQQYFFKGSKQLPNNEIRYPNEFWSEIVSSKIGQYLGFNMLDYNIGYHDENTQKIGCISKSMVDFSVNKLTEGKTFLTGENPNYSPELKSHQKMYTFQFIRSTLEGFRYNNYIKDIVELIIFDAIVGNSDRHQENWSIITKFEETKTKIERKINQNKGNYIKRKIWLFRRLFTSIQVEANKTSESGLVNRLANTAFIKNGHLFNESFLFENEFAPIYDSGCCLGREYEDSKIKKMLENKIMIEKYVKNGVSEIRWRGVDNKINHFELIKLLKEEYSDDINKIITRVELLYSENTISEIVFNIDSELPESLKIHKLSDERKELMLKLLNLRFTKLLELK